MSQPAFESQSQKATPANSYQSSTSPSPLPFDIISIIFPLIDGDHRNSSLISLQRSCRTFYRIVTPLIYRTYTIKSDEQFRLLLAPLVDPQKAHLKELRPQQFRNIEARAFHLESESSERNLSARSRIIDILPLVETIVFQIMPSENLIRIASVAAHEQFSSCLFPNATTVHFNLLPLSEVLGRVHGPIRDSDMASDTEDFDQEGDFPSELAYRFNYAPSRVSSHNYARFLPLLLGPSTVHVYSPADCDSEPYSRFNIRDDSPLVLECPLLQNQLLSIIEKWDIKEMAVYNCHWNFCPAPPGCQFGLHLVECICTNRAGWPREEPQLDFAESIGANIMAVLDAGHPRGAESTWTVTLESEEEDNINMIAECAGDISKQISSERPDQTLFPYGTVSAMGVPLLDCVRFGGRILSETEGI